jgi:hypothetical protein
MQLETLLNKLVNHHQVLGERISVIRNELQDAKEEFDELTQVITMMQEHPQIIEMIQQYNASK